MAPNLASSRHFVVIVYRATESLERLLEGRWDIIGELQ